MYSYIKGSLEAKANNYVVIDVGGIGFKVFMSEPAVERVGELKEVIKVHTHLRVREDDMSLYGFITNEELRMFELLLSVSGIGAKSALTMLANISPSSFALAVIANDISKLVKIPGIGAKSAQRIVLELKDKLKAEEAISKAENREIKEAILEDDKTAEAIAALKVLGYTKKEIDTVLEKIESGPLTVEDMIRQSLTQLGR